MFEDFAIESMILVMVFIASVAVLIKIAISINNTVKKGVEDVNERVLQLAQKYAHLRSEIDGFQEEINSKADADLLEKRINELIEKSVGKVEKKKAKARKKTFA